MARALANKITRKQAMSYEHVPNGIGVTAIAAINGPGSYRARYDESRRLLDGPPRPSRRSNKKRGTQKGASRGVYSYEEWQQMARRTNWHPTPTERRRMSSAMKSYWSEVKGGQKKRPNYRERPATRTKQSSAMKKYWSQVKSGQRSRTNTGRARDNYHLSEGTRDKMSRATKAYWRKVKSGTTKRPGYKVPKKAATKRKSRRKNSTAREMRYLWSRRNSRETPATRGRQSSAMKKYWSEVKSGQRSRRGYRGNWSPTASQRRRMSTGMRSYTGSRANYHMSDSTKQRMSKGMKSYWRSVKRGTKKRKGYRRKNRVSRQRNASAYTTDLMNVLRTGGIATVGYVFHRAVSKIIEEKLLGGMTMKYKNLLASAGVGAIGVALASRYAPGDSKMLGAGMAVGFIQSVLQTVLTAAGQEDLVGYLGNYANAPGNPQYSGMGAYYEFYPHQVYSNVAPDAASLGEYYSTPQPGLSGFGADPPLNLYQAAAGMGGPEQLPNLHQAAAGMGQLEVTQAAAGLGAPPMLTQAAAGAGEYIVTGAEGIGEYEAVTPQYTRAVAIDEGIQPDLTSAEYALSVAEAASGIGSSGQGAGGMGELTWEPGRPATDPKIPLQSIVNPTGQAENIPPVPGGSRAGIFYGSGPGNNGSL